MADFQAAVGTVGIAALGDFHSFHSRVISIRLYLRHSGLCFTFLPIDSAEEPHNLADLARTISSKEWVELVDLWPLHLPFAAPWIGKDLDQSDESRKIGYGLELARLAESMENMDMQKDAKLVWDEAARMTGLTDDELERLKTNLKSQRERIR